MEEFVLIPKKMYMEESPIVNQILSSKDIQNKAKQLSLLQRNSPFSKFTEKATASADKRIEAEVTEAPTQATGVQPEQQSLANPSEPQTYFEPFEHIIQELKFLPPDKLLRCKIILQKIHNSSKVDIDANGMVTVYRKPIDVLASSFLYALQQTRQKLNSNHLLLISTLNLGSHLMVNHAAKRFVDSPTEKLTREATLASKKLKRVLLSTDDEDEKSSGEEDIKSPAGWENFQTKHKAPRETLHTRESGLWKRKKPSKGK